MRGIGLCLQNQADASRRISRSRVNSGSSNTRLATENASGLGVREERPPADARTPQALRLKRRRFRPTLIWMIVRYWVESKNGSAAQGIAVTGRVHLTIKPPLPQEGLLVRRRGAQPPLSSQVPNGRTDHLYRIRGRVLQKALPHLLSHPGQGLVQIGVKPGITPETAGSSVPSHAPLTLLQGAEASEPGSNPQAEARRRLKADVASSSSVRVSGSMTTP